MSTANKRARSESVSPPTLSWEEELKFYTEFTNDSTDNSRPLSRRPNAILKKNFTKKEWVELFAPCLHEDNVKLKCLVDSSCIPTSLIKLEPSKDWSEKESRDAVMDWIMDLQLKHMSAKHSDDEASAKRSLIIKARPIIHSEELNSIPEFIKSMCTADVNMEKRRICIISLLPGLALRCKDHSNKCGAALGLDAENQACFGYGLSEETATEVLVRNLRRYFDEHRKEHGGNPGHEEFRQRALNLKAPQVPQGQNKRVKSGSGEPVNDQ